MKWVMNWKRERRTGQDASHMRVLQAGSAVTDVVIAAALIVFLLIPLFSVVVEKYVLTIKVGMIRDAVDMTNLSAYSAISAVSLGRTGLSLDRDQLMEAYKKLLQANLNLTEELLPEPGSIAEGQVEIRSLEIYTDGFPMECPDGTTILRTSVHSSIVVPVRPSLFREAVLKLLGRENISIAVHMDTEIPLNN